MFKQATYSAPNSLLGASCQRAYAVVLLVVLLAAPGCAHHQKLVMGPGPDEVVPLQEVLDSLAENQDAIHTFQAVGRFEFRSPDIEGTLAGRGSIAFQREPGRLNVVARHRISGKQVLCFTSTESEAMLKILLPKDQQEVYWRNGKVVSSTTDEFKVGQEVQYNLDDITTEMFRFEAWEELRGREVRVQEPYNPETRTVSLMIGPKRKPRRLVTVQGPPWVVVRSEAMGDDGVVVFAEWCDYYVIDQIRFPKHVYAEFLEEGATLDYEIGNLKLNEPLDDDVFRIESPSAPGAH